jgi:hypothetical protein
MIFHNTILRQNTYILSNNHMEPCVLLFIVIFILLYLVCNNVRVRKEMHNPLFSLKIDCSMANGYIYFIIIVVVVDAAIYVYNVRIISKMRQHTFVNQKKNEYLMQFSYFFMCYLCHFCL